MGSGNYRFIFILCVLAGLLPQLNCGGGGGGMKLFPFFSPSGIKGLHVSDSAGNRYSSGSTLSLGSVLISSSSSNNLKIENDGNFTVTLTGNPDAVSKGGIHSSQYTINSQPSSTSLADGDFSSFQIGFQPSSAGVKSAYLIINSDDPNIGTYILYLKGTGTEAPAPAIQVSEGSFNFIPNAQTNFYAASGGTSSKTITVKNSGDQDLVISNISLSGTDAALFSETGSGVTISPKKTYTFTISFSPPSASTFSASISIDSNDPNIASYSIGLSGVGTSGNVPQISVTYSDNNNISRDITSSTGFSYSFGSVFPGVISSSKTITIRNLGSSNLDLSGTPVSLSGTDSAEFAITQPSSANLAPNASATFLVKFSPASTGSKSATVTLNTTTGKGGNPSSSVLNVSGAGGRRDIIVTWAHSKEHAVHMASGAYRVCYNKGSDFSSEGGSVVCDPDVVYAGDPYTPNYKTITVSSAGTWYIRVRSFSQFNLTGSAFSKPIQAIVSSPGY
ncbi:choice-of-anchor D domain-containing protein [Leptospira dzoumogneensis]|uniref:Choice-of-anchor D domain-containing protein n=1 Tax=Leptospira dzoumogneensis TaxID=2484904 RepID=A0A4Z1ARR6_9LEPT|nr:choice-of-anchor D domain-containing protein [Leptospira dzoumogneensis]TGM97714.1 choice-of-anchor D domain-containing protein [Leptospira dzoumogneensis]